MPQEFPLVMIGATNLLAPYLMKRLGDAGMVAEIITRKPVPVPEGFTLTQMDLTRARNWIAPEGAVVISLIPLWLLTQFLPRFIGVKAIIAVGSTSLFSKSGSSDQGERATARNLQQGEDNLREWCKRSMVHGTLLRPTMIYDGTNDNNIARMRRFIRRFRFLPLAAPAKGLRQPIHADDVAKAIVGAINNPDAYDKAFNIAGGEVLTYRAMAERAFAAESIKPRLLMLPTEWLEKTFRAAQSVGILNEKYFGSAIFQRMNEDLVFDVAEGLRVLNYQPRGFDPA